MSFLVKLSITLFLIGLSGKSKYTDGVYKNLESELQKTLDKTLVSSGAPGITLTIRFNNSSEINIASGYAEKGTRKMKPGDRMLGGSTGKMYVSAILLDLIQKGHFNLNDKVETFLANYDWYANIPNASLLEIKNLLQHTSGIPRYIFQPKFLEDISKNSLLDLSPEECLSYVFGKDALFEPGNGFAYSDTNYLLLGLIIEKVTGQQYNELLRSFIKNNGLSSTAPSDSRKLDGLIQGYVVQNVFNLPHKMVKEGRMVVNPAFEWTGGGTITNSTDLAHLAHKIHGKRLLDSVHYALFSQPVNMRSGQIATAGYGLGTFVWDTGDDLKYGHSGFFPGYQSHVEYSTSHQYSIAVQVNTDAGTVNVQSITASIEAVLLKHMDYIDESQIVDNFSMQASCWNNQDIECYMEAYAEDRLIETNSRAGVTYGYDNIIQNYRRNFPKEKMGNLFFDKLKTRKLTSRFYHVTGRYNLNIPGRENTVQGWFSVTMEKIQGKWFMITDHS